MYRFIFVKVNNIKFKDGIKLFYEEKKIGHQCRNKNQSGF